MTKTLLILFLSLFLFGCDSNNITNGSSQTNESKYKINGWKEESIKDEFSGKETVLAEIDSINTQPVGVLSQNRQATIVTWKNQKPGFFPAKIFFNGSAMPNAASSSGECYRSKCSIEVKFDGGAIEKYSVIEGSQDSKNSEVYIESKAFVNKAFNAKKIEIRMSFYQQNDGIFEFDNSNPFIWKK